MKSKEHRILILEDLPTDVDLMERELRRNGISFSSKSVETETDFREGLISYKPDIILSDYNLPAFNGMSALKLVKDISPSIPFIIVTGSMNEETAVECMKAGAADYVIKEHLSRLTSTVKSALEMKGLIEDRRKAEEALRKSEEFNRRIIESSNDCINILDLDGRLLFMNDGGQAMMEIDDVNTLLNESWLDYWDDDIKQLVLEALEKAVNRNIGTFQGYCPTMKGTPKWWDVVITPITNSEGAVERLLAVSRDITELKNQSAQMMQVEKMSTVGTLASGVAHELNNPLMSVLGFTQYCLKHTVKEDKIFAVLKDVEQEAMRCIGIVKNLLTFSHMGKEGVEKKQDASCAKIIERILKLLTYRTEKERVIFIKNYEADIIDAYIQVNGIQQVLLNIIVNALDALKDSDKKEIYIEIKHDDEITNVIIKDTGNGISQKNLDRIFEPFFTTKEVGKGTGLGLSISKSIIENNDGKLICESEIGKGTKFIIQLSKTKKEQTNEKAYLSYR